MPFSSHPWIHWQNGWRIKYLLLRLLAFLPDTPEDFDDLGRERVRDAHVVLRRAGHGVDDGVVGRVHRADHSACFR